VHPEWQPIAVNLEGTPIEMAQNPRPDPARKRLSVEFGLRLANDRQTPVGYLTAVFDLYRVHDLIVNARILKRSGQVLLAYLDQAQVVYLFPPHHLVGKSRSSHRLRTLPWRSHCAGKTAQWKAPMIAA